MFHSLYVGNFDREALRDFRAEIVAPLDSDALEQAAAAAGGTVDERGVVLPNGTCVIKDNYLLCPWIRPNLNEDVVAFIGHLHELTDCVAFEKRHVGELSMDDIAACFTVPESRRDNPSAQADWAGALEKYAERELSPSDLAKMRRRKAAD